MEFFQDFLRSSSKNPKIRSDFKELFSENLQKFLGFFPAIPRSSLQDILWRFSKISFTISSRFPPLLLQELLRSFNERFKKAPPAILSKSVRKLLWMSSEDFFRVPRGIYGVSTLIRSDFLRELFWSSTGNYLEFPP